MQGFQLALSNIQAGNAQVTILSTSRCHVVFHHANATIQEVQPLAASEAQEMLRCLCPALNIHQSEQLAEQCNNIPLALEVVAYTIRQTAVMTAEVGPSTHFVSSVVMLEGRLKDCKAALSLQVGVSYLPVPQKQAC